MYSNLSLHQHPPYRKTIHIVSPSSYFNLSLTNYKLVGNVMAARGSQVQKSFRPVSAGFGSSLFLSVDVYGRLCIFVFCYFAIFAFGLRLSGIARA